MTRVLLIEDSRVQAERLRLLLIRHGYEVVTAYDAEEGLAFSRSSAPDVVLTDVVMPGMDGLEMTRRMKEDPRLRHVPIIVLTTSSEPVDVLRVLDSGADNFVAKPYEDDALVARLARTLEAGAVSTGARGIVPEHARRLFRSALEDADAARRKADVANAVKDDFLATISHELRTPLNAIGGWAQLLLDGKLPEEKKKHALEVISRNAQVQIRLIEDLLEVSRFTTGTLRMTAEPVDLRAVVDHAVEAALPLARARNQELLVTVRDDVRVLGDAARLQQVVSNLLNNAKKFSSPGQSIEIELVREGNGARISVRDRGRGIATEQLPHLFERFRQAHERRPGDSGLGLGLAIAAQLIERHGGRIDAQSAGPGTGATFSIWLPGISSAKDEPSDEHEVLDGVSVLLVDDEPDIRELATIVLESAGARVQSVGSADEAIRLLAPSHHVLICDLSMPRKTGLDLIRAIRGRPSTECGRVPAIAFTGLPARQIRQEALSAGFDGFLNKPADRGELIRAVRLLATAGRAAS